MTLVPFVLSLSKDRSSWPQMLGLEEEVQCFDKLSTNGV